GVCHRSRATVGRTTTAASAAAIRTSVRDGRGGRRIIAIRRYALPPRGGRPPGGGSRSRDVLPAEYVLSAERLPDPGRPRAAGARGPAEPGTGRCPGPAARGRRAPARPAACRGGRGRGPASAPEARADRAG